MRKRARNRKVRYAVLYTVGTPAISHFNCANDKSVSRSIPDIREELEQAFVVSELQKNAFAHISFDHVRIISPYMRTPAQ